MEPFEYDGAPEAVSEELDLFSLLAPPSARDKAGSAPQMAFSSYSQHPMPVWSAEADAMHDYRSPATGSSSLMLDRRDDSDLLFTPLMSPAMTPMSSIFASSTGMPSTFKPIDEAANSLAASHIHPAEIFSPLSSPALVPQYAHQPAIVPSAALPPPQPQPQQLRMLQSLLHQAAVQTQNPADAGQQQQQMAAFLQGQRQVLQALGFGHLLTQPDDLQSNLTRILLDGAQLDASQPQPGSSGESASSQTYEQRGMGRGRGASRTAPKTRPSPIIKPVNGGGGAGNGAGRPRSRRPSISNSSYGSPSFPPSVYSSVGPQPLGMAGSGAVLEESPSPIELNSFIAPSDAHRLASSDAARPITPATLMNLSGPEINLLSGLSPSMSMPTHPGMPPELELQAPYVPLSSDMELQAAQAHHQLQQQMEAQQQQQQQQQQQTVKRRAPVPAPVPAQAPKAKARAPRKAKANSASKLKEPDYKDIDMAPEEEDRKTSHKHAEQARRDSLKMCFEELRHILPYIPPEEDEDAPRRPGEGNVGGQRSGLVDPANPNKGVSKVALLRKSNEYIAKLHDRVLRRDAAIGALRAKLASVGIVPEYDADLATLELDNMDVAAESGAWPYPALESQLAAEEDDPMAATAAAAPKKPASKRGKRRSGDDATDN